jgi:GNAT superfamily N-acetyltransferase
MLAARGHKMDGAPRAMFGDLATMALVPQRDLDCRETRDIGMVARLNDAAYGFPPPAFDAALTSAPFELGWRAFEARIGDTSVGCALTCDGTNADVGVTCIATIASARGQQVASRLLSFALREARERGMRTTTLQASSKGKHLYERLGYEDLGALEMWEHRVPRPA